MDRIVFEQPDGSVEIYTAVEPKIGAETDAAYLDRLAAKAQAQCPHLRLATRRQNIAPGTVPNDKTFRGAWSIAGNRVDVDLDKAREIQQDRLRELRAPLLAALDTASIRAIEAGDRAAQDAIAQKKQALRDVTDDPSLQAARTPDELKVAGLSVLSANQALAAQSR